MDSAPVASTSTLLDAPSERVSSSKSTRQLQEEYRKSQGAAFFSQLPAVPAWPAELAGGPARTGLRPGYSSHSSQTSAREPSLRSRKSFVSEIGVGHPQQQASDASSVHVSCHHASKSC